jgi:hypothetical protein
MSHYQDKRHHRESREYQKRDYQERDYGRQGSILGEFFGEIPVIGELFDSLSGIGISKKGIKKVCCCCLPIGLVLLMPVIWFCYTLLKGGLSLVKVDAGWLETGKNWLLGNFDQIGQWFGALGNLFGQ